jgi:hypothetical protein
VIACRRQDLEDTAISEWWISPIVSVRHQACSITPHESVTTLIGFIQCLQQAAASKMTVAYFINSLREEVPMTRFASFIALAAFLTFGLGTAVSFASEPAPVEQKDKKDMSGSKADDDSKKKDEKKEMGK